MTRWKGWGHDTPQVFPRVPLSPSLPSHVRVPFASFPSAVGLSLQPRQKK